MGAQEYWNRRFGSGQLSAARAAAKKFIGQESAKIAEPFSRQAKVQDIETNEIPQQRFFAKNLPKSPNLFQDKQRYKISKPTKFLSNDFSPRICQNRRTFFKTSKGTRYRNQRNSSATIFRHLTKHTLYSNIYRKFRTKISILVEKILNFYIDYIMNLIFEMSIYYGIIKNLEMMLVLRCKDYCC